VFSDRPSSSVVPSASIAEATSATAIEARTRAEISVGAEVQAQPDAPLSPINEAIPSVPQSALQTIRGTVRVTIRVIIDKQGTVVAATSDIPGPSRYFERLSLEAARKWTFTPADTEDPRVMQVRFHYTREGVTARANPPQ
jgi:TonB family protein